MPDITLNPRRLTNLTLWIEPADKEFGKKKKADKSESTDETGKADASKWHEAVTDEMICWVFEFDKKRAQP